MLTRDNSGAAAAEYALILAGIGVAMALASLAFGAAVKNGMEIQATGPDGTVYRCTANCQYDYEDYCALVLGRNLSNAPVTIPALPAGAKCDGETPIS